MPINFSQREGDTPIFDIVQGYRKKPVIIPALGVCYLLLPLVTLYQLYLQVNGSIPLLKEIIVSPFYLMDAFCSITAGIAVMAVNRFSFFYFIVLSTYAICLRLYYLRLNVFPEHPLEFFLIAVWLFGTLLLLLTTLRIPYLNPQARWWRQPVRYKHLVTGVLQSGKYKFPVVSLNLAAGGVFLRLDERALGSAQKDLTKGKEFQERRKEKPTGDVVVSGADLEHAKHGTSFYPGKLGDRVRIHMNVVPEARKIFPENRLESEAEIVWTTRVTGPFRYGVGLKFMGQNAEMKRRLRQYVRFLHEAGMRSPSR